MSEASDKSSAVSRRVALKFSAMAGLAAAVSEPALTAANATPAGGPHAYPGFGGYVGRTAIESKPWWPPEKRAPDKAPNIIVVLCDDMGFSDIGCFGSEIQTPNLDRLAAEGLRYTNFHSEPTCSPTRAALLTGINPHAVGFGLAVPNGSDPGFPGYTFELAEDAATSAEVLRDNGYATLAVGKWHLCREIDVHEGMSTSSWPTRRGFDRYYGHWGCPNLHQPEEIWEDNHIVQTDRYPDGYFYTDDLTERAIAMIRSVRQGDPDRPYFLHLALSSPHAPINAKPDDIAKYHGRYDAGWDTLREERFHRQKQLGVVGPNTRLPPRNSEIGMEADPWTSLTDRQREMAARYMEIYAGLVDNIDQCFGRLRAAIEAMGEWDNTIVVFTADNGASKEGFRTGSSQYGDLIRRVIQEQATGKYSAAGDEQLDLDYQAMKAGLLGGPQTLPHYPQAWAMVGNTPFRLYKASTYCGGHQVPFIFSWPAALKDKGGIRPQYTHVTDVLPTLLDLTGLQHPRERAGRKLREMTGVSFAPTLTEPRAPSHHIEQYTESTGSRRYYRNGWAIVTLHRPNQALDDREWRLYDLAADPTEIDDLAGSRPDMVRAMSQAWEKAAWANRVFPLNEGSGVMLLTHAPGEARYARPLALYPHSPTVPSWRARWLMEGRSFTVNTAFRYAEGDAGTLFKHGGQGGGYGLYIEDGELRFILNGYGRMTELPGGRLAAGDHEAMLTVKALPGFRWDIALHRDGALAASKVDLPMLAMLAPIGGIDIGIDRRTPVSWRLYEKHGAFPYSGAMKWVRYEPGAWAPDMDPALAERMRQNFRHAE